jgi:hypothetical protein
MVMVSRSEPGMPGNVSYATGFTNECARFGRKGQSEVAGMEVLAAADGVVRVLGLAGECGAGGPSPGTEPLFSWSVDTGDPTRGACGVALDEDGALAAVEQALTETCGVDGWVVECRLSDLADAPTYVYGPMVAQAERDRDSGAVAWRGDPW